MKRDIKKRILEAAVQLIGERGSDTDSVTIRDICGRAGVGTGLVNYHFQTKENLIAQCVQLMVGSVIERCDVLLEGMSELEPAERLCALLRAACDYLAAHENIARISILTDLQTPRVEDNTARTVAACLPAAREARPDWDEQTARERTYGMVFALQGAFLRSGALAAETGADWKEKTQRDALVGRIVDAFLLG